jgi:predicted dehydrogenase
LQAYDDPAFQQILYRVLRLLAKHFEPHRTYGVGLLGYAQSVGQPHGLGIEATPGLILRAACDLDKERLRQAQQDFPEVKTYDSADGLAMDPEVDVVIVATPPNTHATLSVQMMEAAKHVVCEKPLALSRKEAAAMVEMAEKQRVHLSCHQNRRWDVDYLAIKQALAEGLIGELFYLETFVGGFNHPCGYWHSHDAISGGTTYDWGAHYLDWVVSLIPERVTGVISTRQNRVWHDVTNADQERIQIRFAGGMEAEFIHSDIAAVRKPKWYVLGTKGAIVGHWRDVSSYETDPIVYFHEHHIPATEMVPDLTLHHRHHSGQILVQKLALPERKHYLFHRNLADHLLTGEPIVAPLDDSVRVVGILEAAARSAAKGGTVEGLND